MSYVGIKTAYLIYRSISDVLICSFITLCSFLPTHVSNEGSGAALDVDFFDCVLVRRELASDCEVGNITCQS